MRPMIGMELGSERIEGLEGFAKEAKKDLSGD